jgi:hypothetical protein
MTPEEMFPFFAAYAVCAGSVIIFSLFATAVFLGLAVLDLWNNQSLSKITKIFVSSGFVLFPEIGVLSWAVYLGRNRKLVFRIIAFVTSGLYLLLQTGMFYVSALHNGLRGGLISTAMMHFMWLPFMPLVGVVSFLIFRAVTPGNSVSSSNLMS